MKATQSNNKLRKKKAATYFSSVTLIAIAAVWLALAFQINADTELTSQANAKANVDNRDTEVRRVITEVIVKERPEDDGVSGDTAAPESSSSSTGTNSAPVSNTSSSQPQQPQTQQPAPQPTTRTS